MKIITLFVICCAFSVNAYANVSEQKNVQKNEKVTKINVPPELASILKPIFAADFLPNLKKIQVTALIDISESGSVTRVSRLQTIPVSLPQEQIIKSIFLAKFTPQLYEEIPVATENFEFEWEFQVQRLPIFELDVDID